MKSRKTVATSVLNTTTRNEDNCSVFPSTLMSDWDAEDEVNVGT
jgi:hypothetical protein